jgi:hypothetical protein
LGSEDVQRLRSEGAVDADGVGLAEVVLNVHAAPGGGAFNDALAEFAGAGDILPLEEDAGSARPARQCVFEIEVDGVLNAG